MPSRASSLLLAGALLLGGSPARAQTAVDPLTGATPDFGAALGAKSYEPVYFDSQGNVTDNAKDAVKYAITDNVQGMSTLPKPIGQMTPEDRQKLGLAEPPAEKTASTDKPAAQKPAEQPKAQTQTAAVEPGKADADAQIVSGSEVTDPETGLVYGDVKPQLVEAAKESFSPPTEGGASSSGRASFASGDAPAQKWVAPAVAAQAAVIEPGGASPRGYRALNTLVGLRDNLVLRIQSFLGKGGEAGLSGYGIVYDGAAARVAPVLETRVSDARFAVGQTTAE